MKLGIKEGKIYDICSIFHDKRDDSIKDRDYLDFPRGNWVIGDTWDSLNNISLRDAPIRSAPKPKTEFELLEARIKVLEAAKKE